MPTYTAKPIAVTYLGVPATVRAIRATRRTHSERVVITEWHATAVGQPVAYPAGTVVAAHMNGDGRTPHFEVFATQTFDSVDAAVAWAHERIPCH